MAGSFPTLPWLCQVSSGRKHHVARPEGDVLAADAGEIALAGQAEPDGIGRVPVRRHHLVGIVEPVCRVHGAHGGAPRRQARIDQNERAALGIVHRHQLGRPKQDRLDVVLVAPHMRHGLLRAHQLLDLVVRHIGRASPRTGTCALRRCRRRAKQEPRPGWKAIAPGCCLCSPSCPWLPPCRSLLQRLAAHSSSQHTPRAVNRATTIAHAGRM